MAINDGKWVHGLDKNRPYISPFITQLTTYDAEDTENRRRQKNKKEK